MSDLLWGYVRQALLAFGVALVVHYFSVPEAQAATFVNPAVELIMGILMTIVSPAWMTLVKANTKAVPLMTAKRIDVPTVSPVSGKVIR